MSAVAACPMLASQAKTGKQAIKNEHRELIIETRQAKVGLSVDFEAAAAQAGASRLLKRWDYVLETRNDAASLHAVEVHEFDRSVLKQKKAGTLEILRNRCPATALQVKSWHVILKGALPRQDMLARFRVDSGISLGRELHITKL